MANYPPPPPGGWAPPPGAGWDPHAYERMLADWASARQYQLVPHGDVRWYQAWYPFAFLFGTARVGREVRLSIGDASVAIAETFEGDAVKAAINEDRHLVAFVMSPRLAYRAALRSRTGGAGLVDEIGKGLDDLFGSKRSQGFLGDPTFEGRYEVLAPTREEAAAALPVPLRQTLLQLGFRGILEVRAQGLVVTFFDRTAFEPATLDHVIAAVAQILSSATQYPHVVTPPR